MPEEILREVKVFQADAKCPECTEGVLHAGGGVCLSSPPQYPHKCNKCGYITTFSGASYPTIRYKLVGEIEPNEAIQPDDARAAQCLPPEGTPAHTYHWFCRNDSDNKLIGRWLPMNGAGPDWWYVTGESEAISAREMCRHGWIYRCQVAPCN